MGDVGSRADPSEPWWGRYERDFAHGWWEEPFHRLFSTIVEQSVAVYGPAWPGCSLVVSRSDSHSRSGGQPAGYYGVSATTHPGAGAPMIELRVSPGTFGPAAFAAVPALLVRECVCHVPVRPRDGADDDHDRGMYREGFVDWAAEFFLHRWAGLLEPDISGPALRHGTVALFLDRMGSTPRCHSRRVGRRSAEESAAWFRNSVLLCAEESDASVARLAVELNMDESLPEHKDLVVSRLRFTPYPIDLRAALADWLAHRGDVAAVIRAAAR